MTRGYTWQAPFAAGALPQIPVADYPSTPMREGNASAHAGEAPQNVELHGAPVVSCRPMMRTVCLDVLHKP